MRLRSYRGEGGGDAFAQAFTRLPSQLRAEAYRCSIMPPALERMLLELPLPTPVNFWLVEDGGRPVGRIGANVSTRYAGTGYVGFYELDTAHARAREASRMLIDAACGFLREFASVAYGPLNLNTWLPYRFRVDEGDGRGFAWEPANPPHYVDQFLAAGFVRAAEYHSTAFGDLDRFLEETRADYEDAVRSGFRFRRLDWSRLAEGEAAVLYRISMEAFGESFLFEPIPQSLFERYIVASGEPGQDCTHVAVSPQGGEVGFFYAFVDHGFSRGSAAAETYAVLKSTGVVGQARGRGLSNALAHLAVQAARDEGADYAIAALVRAGLQSESYAKKGELFWRRRYALFERRL